MTANPHPGKTALTELVEGLEGVTEGPWEVFDGCSWRRIGRAASPQNPREDDCAVLAPTKASDGHPDLTCSRGNDRERNLDHIARCSPDRIKAIAEYVGELEERNRQLAVSARYAIEAHATGRFEPAQAAVENLKNTLDDFYAACEADDRAALKQE